jgi:hypothetical protein
MRLIAPLCNGQVALVTICVHGVRGPGNITQARHARWTWHAPGTDQPSLKEHNASSES